ncbi:MAG: TRAP transporter small permease [Granulosicoccus sp.]
MRRILDFIYNLSGAIAAALIASICLLVTAQVILNLTTKLLGTSASYSIPSYADFAGFFLAASSFLALAYTFTQGGHIRVTLFLGRVSTTPRWIAEIVSISIATVVTLFIFWHMTKLAHESYIYGDVSPGMVVIHLWIPQGVVCIGILILTIALIDTLIQTIQAKKPVIKQKETI